MEIEFEPDGTQVVVALIEDARRAVVAQRADVRAEIEIDAHGWILSGMYKPGPEFVVTRHARKGDSPTASRSPTTFQRQLSYGHRAQASFFLREADWQIEFVRGERSGRRNDSDSADSEARQRMSFTVTQLVDGGNSGEPQLMQRTRMTSGFRNVSSASSVVASVVSLPTSTPAS
jgi:hypothetical protein